MKIPKHREIFERIQRAIVDGQYRPGSKLPSDGQLTRRFDTSRPTVARAMRDLQNAGLVDRRPGSGSYVRLTSDSSQFLGLLIPGLGETEIFEPICGAIARVSQDHHFSLLWGNSSPIDGEVKDQAHVAKTLCRQYIEQRVSGVFFAPVELTAGMDEVNQRVAEELHRAGVAVVLLDRDFEKFPRRSRFDLVGIDNRRAGYVQAEHLLQSGCRHIQYVARPMSAPTVDARIRGYREALQDCGIQPENDWVRRVDPSDTECVRRLVKRCPDAFLCANDITAAQLLHNLIKLGVRIPEDVRVMGLDDVKYAQLLSVPLSTLNQPCRAIGAAAVETMIRRMENRDMPARDILIDFKLVVRESCGGVPQGGLHDITARRPTRPARGRQTTADASRILPRDKRTSKA